MYDRERTNPEMMSERDALELLRQRRSTVRKKPRDFRLSMTARIGAIGLIFGGIILGVWTMKNTQTRFSDAELPTLSGGFEEEDFKVAPSEEDGVHIPHSDKTFYNEMEHTKRRTAPVREKFRKVPEQPLPQVSQEALSNDMANTPTPATTPQNAPAPSAADKHMQAARQVTQEAQKALQKLPKISVAGTPESAQNVTVVESGNSKRETLQASPRTATQKPRKSLEMAIMETKRNIHKDARELYKQKNLNKNSVKTTQPPRVTKPIAQLQKAPKRTFAAAPTATQNVGPKTYWVQVASLKTEAGAEDEWRRLTAKHGLGNSHRNVRVDLGRGKGIRYRVQVGPFTKGSAISQCKKIKSQGGGCWVVKG